MYIHTEEVCSYSLPSWLQAKVNRKREGKYFVNIAATVLLITLSSSETVVCVCEFLLRKITYSISNR